MRQAVGRTCINRGKIRCRLMFAHLPSECRKEDYQFASSTTICVCDLRCILRVTTTKIVSLRRILRARIVVEQRRQPALGSRDVPALAFGIIGDLVALDLADAEISALRMRVIKAADR